MNLFSDSVLMVSRSPAITYLTVTRAVSAIVKLLVFLVRKKSQQLYLLGDLDKEDEDSENKRVVQDADSADDNVDDLEWKQMTLSAKTRMCARWTCVSWSWSWSWSSCSHVSVVLHASHINDAFSIAAENSISCQPRQLVDCRLSLPAADAIRQPQLRIKAWFLSLRNALHRTAIQPALADLIKNKHGSDCLRNAGGMPLAAASS